MKKGTSDSYLIQLIVFSIITAIVVWLWQQYASSRFQTSLNWSIWLFFIISTALIHRLLLKTAESPKKFVYYYMGLSGIKLFTYLIIILLYALIRREGALGFTLFFLVMYLLYTAFEVKTLFTYFKIEKEQ